jgi:hypothetical protein
MLSARGNETPVSPRQHSRLPAVSPQFRTRTNFGGLKKYMPDTRNFELRWAYAGKMKSPHQQADQSSDIIMPM